MACIRNSYRQYDVVTIILHTPTAVIEHTNHMIEERDLSVEMSLESFLSLPLVYTHAHTHTHTHTTHTHTHHDTHASCK